MQRTNRNQSKSYLPTVFIVSGLMAVIGIGLTLATDAAKPKAGPEATQKASEMKPYEGQTAQALYDHFGEPNAFREATLLGVTVQEGVYSCSDGKVVVLVGATTQVIQTVEAKALTPTR